MSAPIFRRKVRPPNVEDHSKTVLEYVAADFRTADKRFRIYSNHYTSDLTLSRTGHYSIYNEISIPYMELDKVIELLTVVRDRYQGRVTR